MIFITKNLHSNRYRYSTNKRERLRKSEFDSLPMPSTLSVLSSIFSSVDCMHTLHQLAQKLIGPTNGAIFTSRMNRSATRTLDSGLAGAVLDRDTLAARSPNDFETHRRPAGRAASPRPGIDHHFLSLTHLRTVVEKPVRGARLFIVMRNLSLPIR